MCAVRISSSQLCSRSVETLESRLLLAGDVDAEFAGGQIIRDILGGDDFAFGVAVQSDGKVLVAGRAWTSSTTGNDFALLRFNADGTPDGTFGVGGLVTTDLGSTSDSASAIVIQPDGRIVLAGETRRSSTLSDFALVRYNADGTPDTTFGTGGSGKVFTDFSLGTDQARSVALTTDGKIVVAGSATVSGRTRVAIARYTSAGVLDASFGSGGKVSTLFIPGTARASSITPLSDGSILVAGTVLDFSTSAQDWVALRYSASGALDSSFGFSGWVRIDMGGDVESASSLLVQSDGRIVLVGDNSDSAGGTSDFALARLLGDGTLDPSFGDSGRVLADFAGEFDQATSATLQADGRIVVAGLASINGTSCFGVTRFSPDGAVDTGFGTNGLVMLSFGAGDVANAVAVDQAARIVVAGFTMDSAGDFDFAVTRLLGNAAPQANAGSGYVVTAGQSVTLDGSASSDPDGAIVAYEWDLDYDGSLFDTDATGVTVSFSTAGLLAPSTRTVALRVTDNQGATHI
ncbi:MAG TPA: PKD domain-containing protein, partial [Tepidisphaeraceae bacterium]|nr:PKD domain-containing protein [Tepidisphaeraceae bacterium]